METSMRCPLCSLTDVKEGLRKKALKCPVCNDEFFILKEEFSNMQTNECEENSLFRGLQENIAIVYVSKQRRYDLEESKLFNEYHMMRTGIIDDKQTEDSQVDVTSTSIVNEFPFTTMKSSLVNSVCQDNLGTFWVYTKRLVETRPVFINEEHIGYYSSTSKRPVVIDINRKSRIIFGGGSYKDYKVEVSKVIDNKAYFTVEDRECNIIWLDARIIYQLGYTPQGSFCIRLAFKEEDAFKDLFSATSLGDLNPLSIASRVRDLVCYPKITSDLKINSEYKTTEKKENTVSYNTKNNYYNYYGDYDDDDWPVSHTNHSYNKGSEKAHMYASDGIIIEEYEENNQTLEETLEELSF